MTEGRPVEEWRRDLASPTTEIRRRAVTVLAYAADDSPGALASVLTPALRDTDPGIRLTAALAMAPSAQEAVTVTSVLVSALTARDLAFRRAGSMGLARMGPAAKDAAPVLLLSFATDPDATVRQNSANALLYIGPAAKDVVPGLMGALQHRDPEVRRAAATILSDFGMAAPSTRPAWNGDARPQSQTLAPSGRDVNR
jgi:HEAT repeat protein